MQARWPQRYRCLTCERGVSRTLFERKGRMYWQCADCGHQCSLTSGTIFASTKLPLPVWFLAMQLFTQVQNNVSALERNRQIGVCCRSAWLLKHKVLEVIRVAEVGRQLTGRVEIDDAYLGRQNAGGKTGRGSENKVPFGAAIQTTEDGKPHLVCLSQRSFSKASLHEFFARSTALPLRVVSDGLECFAMATTLGAVHDREVAGGGARPASRSTSSDA